MAIAWSRSSSKVMADAPPLQEAYGDGPGAGSWRPPYSADGGQMKARSTEDIRRGGTRPQPHRPWTGVTPEPLGSTIISSERVYVHYCGFCHEFLSVDALGGSSACRERDYAARAQNCSAARSSMSSSTWRVLSGYATYQRTPIRMISGGK